LCTITLQAQEALAIAQCCPFHRTRPKISGEHRQHHKRYLLSALLGPSRMGMPTSSYLPHPQVSVMLHIAQTHGPPPLPESLSTSCRDFLQLCFNRHDFHPTQRLNHFKHPKP